MMQNKEGVMIRCADGTTYHGDILVGAGGAHSGVRKGLYQTLQQQNLLPPSDATELSKGFLAMVGTTDPMDPEQYPFLKSQASTFNQVIGRGTSFQRKFFSSLPPPYPTPLQDVKNSLSLFFCSIFMFDLLAVVRVQHA